MKKRDIKLKETIYQHINNNKKEYVVIVLIFIVGIFLGVFFVNNVKEIQRQEINNYINDFIEKLKTSDNIDSISVLTSSINQNIVIALGLWFFGTTVIRYTNSIWNCTL